MRKGLERICLAFVTRSLCGQCQARSPAICLAKEVAAQDASSDKVNKEGHVFLKTREVFQMYSWWMAYVGITQPSYLVCIFGSL